MGLPPGNRQEGGAQPSRPHFVSPWAHHCLLQEEPKEEKEKVILSRGQRPPASPPALLPASRGSARALWGRRFLDPNHLVTHAT